MSTHSSNWSVATTAAASVTAFLVIAATAALWSHSRVGIAKDTEDEGDRGDAAAASDGRIPERRRKASYSIAAAAAAAAESAKKACRSILGAIIGVELEGVLAETKRHEIYMKTLKSFVPPPKPECPICMIPLPLESEFSRVATCCGKTICDGCDWESRIAVADESSPFYDPLSGRRCKNRRCAFCRTPNPLKIAEIVSRVRRRVDAGDAWCMTLLGDFYINGPRRFVERDVDKGMELYRRAAKSGCLKAAHRLGKCYDEGKICNRDEDLAVHYLEMAARGGNVIARYDLAVKYMRQVELDNTARRRLTHEKAMAHLCMAARGGLPEALDGVQWMHERGGMSKEEFQEILRSFRCSKEEMDSDSRRTARRAQAQQNGGP